jgi:uncharacterized Fe-S cluster protein YjdI
MHSGICARSLPLVFDPRRRPWVDVSKAADEVIAEQVARCPSGALRIRRASGAGLQESREAVNR